MIVNEARILENLIYEVICDIESDFENKLTVSDIYKKLVKVRTITRDSNKELEVALWEEMF